MTSYLRSWFSSGLATTQPTLPTTDVVIQTTPPQDDEDGEDSDNDTVRGNNDEDDHEDDKPPAFPSLNSAQRVGSSTSTSTARSGPSSSDSNRIPSVLSSSKLMPPPPVPSLASRRPGAPVPSSPSPSSSLSVPPSLGVPSGLGVGGSLAPPTTTKAPPKKSRKVMLAPGFGPLDWGNLKKSGTDLRGVESLMRVPMSVLKQHNKRDDAWSAFNGKVYNITHYLPFHPGGEKELMRVAGRDGTKLFALTHAWVNVDFMLDECLVGFLVPDS